MRTIDKRLAAKLAPVLVKRAPTLTLAWDARCKSRFAATLDTGEEVGVVLPRGTVLRDGDMLVADDGGLVRVIAAAESVLLVRAPDRLTLTRAAYHLGNRHTPVELGADTLKLEVDPVLEDMLRRLGAQVEHATRPFHPESGAYGGGHRHGHDATFAEDHALAQRVFDEHHGHGHGPHGVHDHAHGQEPAHEPSPGSAHGHGPDDGHAHPHRPEHGHVHGPGCDHAHDPDAGDGHAHPHAHGDGGTHGHAHR